MNRIYKLKNGDSIGVVNSKNNGILIKNNNDTLKVLEIKEQCSNLYIKNITESEVIGFVLTILLENNSLEIKENKENSELIGKLLDNEFKKLLGDSKLDVVNTEFQVITTYEKE